MTVKIHIQDYISNHGRSTNSEIANGIGYHPDYVRRNAKDMVDNNVINGEKVPVRIPAAEINGELVILTDSRSGLLDIIRKHAPNKLSEAKGMTVQELQALVRSIASDTFAIDSERWEFW